MVSPVVGYAHHRIRSNSPGPPTIAANALDESSRRIVVAEFVRAVVCDHDASITQAEDLGRAMELVLVEAVNHANRHHGVFRQVPGGRVVPCWSRVFDDRDSCAVAYRSRPWDGIAAARRRYHRKGKGGRKP